METSGPTAFDFHPDLTQHCFIHVLSTFKPGLELQWLKLCPLRRAAGMDLAYVDRDTSAVANASEVEAVATMVHLDI